MVCHRDIKFPQGTPSVEEFVGKINEITGLQVMYSEYEIWNPEYRRDNFHYIYDHNLISLTVWGYTHVNYLLGVGLYALVQLGGDFGNGFIPVWASLRWEDIKNKVDKLPGYPPPKNPMP